MFEVTEPTNFNIQVFGPVLQPNRAYHLCGVFEGNGFTNEVKFFVDGVEQILAIPTNRQPNTADLNLRGVGQFGDPPTGEGIGESTITITGADDGHYNQWAICDGADAILTDDEIRKNLFEQGALPDITINSGTEGAMQTAIDAEADSVGNDVPSDIRIEDVTGGGNLELTLDNRTFNSLASIHIQYMGTDTLTIVNSNGSNASIGSTPNGGTIIFLTPTTVEITVVDASTQLVVEGARVLLEAFSGGTTPTGTDIIGDNTNASGIVTTTFNYESDQPVIGRVRKGTASIYYKTSPIVGTITSNGLSQTIIVIQDE